MPAVGTEPNATNAIGHLRNIAALMALDISDIGTEPNFTNGFAILKKIAEEGSFGGGGSATPGLPIWTYEAGAMAAGKMNTDSATIHNTAVISLSSATKNNPSTFETPIRMFPIGGIMVFTDATGAPYFFRVSGVSPPTAGQIDFDVIPYEGSPIPWDGDYQVSFFAYEPNLDAIFVTNAIVPVADGTYTVGLGVSTNGEITTVKGIITAIQEATP